MKIIDSKQNCIKWGVPDWRDAAAYPHSDDLADNAWRWEFLRRREDYRRHWETAYVTTVNWYKRHTEKECFAKKLKGPIGDGWIDPVNWETPHTSINFIVRSPEAAKYGLEIMANPQTRDGHIRFCRPFLTAHGATVNSLMALNLDPWISDEEHIHCLLAGLAHIRRTLKWNDIVNGHRGKWVDYLRVLDAEAVGASDDDLFKTLCHKSKSKTRRVTVANLRDQAHDIQDRITLKRFE